MLWSTKPLPNSQRACHQATEVDFYTSLKPVTPRVQTALESEERAATLMTKQQEPLENPFNSEFSLMSQFGDSFKRKRNSEQPPST